MFKKFIENIAKAKNKVDAVNNVFYGENGIDMAYQKRKDNLERIPTFMGNNQQISIKKRVLLWIKKSTETS